MQLQILELHLLLGSGPINGQVSNGSYESYSVEKLPNWDFENFRQKHIFSETL